MGKSPCLSGDFQRQLRDFLFPALNYNPHNAYLPFLVDLLQHGHFLNTGSTPGGPDVYHRQPVFLKNRLRLSCLEICCFKLYGFKFLRAHRGK